MLKNKNIKFKRRVLVAGIVASAVAAIVPCATSSAWGPERSTFTMKNPADYATFNSITDNPAIGDERNFVRIRDVNSNDPYRDNVTVVPGGVYEVYIYFHNDGKSSLNKSGAGIARGVKVTSALSSWKVNAQNKVKVSAVLKAVNTKPLEVWDDAYISTASKDDITLSYISGTAIIHNDYKANGSILSDKYLFGTDGVYIGENELDGLIPACAEWSGYITYRVRADQASSKISKTVSKDGKNFFETVDAKPGDTLTYKIEFENTGTYDLTDVTFRDSLPEGVTLVPGTTIMKDVKSGKETKMNDVIGQNGFNTGTYSPSAKVILTYQVKVNGDVVNEVECNKTRELKNTIHSVYHVGADDKNGEVYDSSVIKIAKVCDDTPDTPDTPTVPETPKTPDEPVLPKTGPGEIALAIVAVVCIATGGIDWYRSQKEVAKIQSNVEGKDAGGDGADPNATTK